MRKAFEERPPRIVQASSKEPLIMGLAAKEIYRQGEELASAFPSEGGEFLVLRQNSPEELAWSREVLLGFRRARGGKARFVGYSTSTTVSFRREEPYGLDELVVWEKGREPFREFLRRLFSRDYDGLFLFLRLPLGWRHFLLLLGAALLTRARRKVLVLPGKQVLREARWKLFCRLFRSTLPVLLKEGAVFVFCVFLRLLGKAASLRGGCLRLPKRVLVLRPDHLGDVISSIPAFRLLRQALPQAKIEVWIGPWCEGLKDLLEEAVKVRIFPLPWHSRGRRAGLDWFFFPFRSFASGLRRFDVVLLPRGDPRDVLWVGLLWGRKVVVPAKSFVAVWHFLKLDHLRRFMLLSVETPEHQVSSDYFLVWQYLRALRLRLEEPWPDLPPRVSPPPEAVQGALAKLGDFSRPLVVVHPFAYMLGRNWPLSKAARFIRGLVREFGGTVVITGSKEQTPLARKLASMSGLGDIRVLAGRLDMSELWGLISACDLMVSVDTGPLHFGAISQVPLVALFGPGNVAQWGPRHEGAFVVRANLLCGPCFFICTGPFELAPCMRAIEVRDILRVAREILDSRGFKRRGAWCSLPA